MRTALTLLAALASTALARTPVERLKEDRLQAVHSQIVEWKKTRANFPSQGVYQDFRTVILPESATPEALVPAAQASEVQVIFGAGATGLHGGVLFMAAPALSGTQIFHGPQEQPDGWLAKFKDRFKDYPDEAFGAHTDIVPDVPAAPKLVYASSHLPPPVRKGKIDYAVAFRHATTHVLARELSESDIRASLDAGHAYVAHDWMCDPTGLAFFAESYFGVYEMGDTVQHNPLFGGATISARLPVPAHIRLLRDNVLVAEANDRRLTYIVRDQGAYRLEALLSIDGEERPWIFTSPLYVREPINVALPAGQPSPNVEVRADVPYTGGSPADAPKHMLDLYLPRDKQSFPVLLFVHGGTWRTGDRSVYKALGDRLARAGIGVAIPSYRLMPQNPHPAQIEDVAAAFAWVHKNIPQYGGDTSRIYLSGHSAGGHLVSLLALDEKYLGKFGLSRASIRGVFSMSGVYDLSRVDSFVAAGDKNDASPLAHVVRGAPRFFVSYCQWDYLALPKQARDFISALRKNFVNTELLYIPGQNHISEVISLVQERGQLIDALLNFVQ